MRVLDPRKLSQVREKWVTVCSVLLVQCVVEFRKSSKFIGRWHSWENCPVVPLIQTAVQLDYVQLVTVWLLAYRPSNRLVCHRDRSAQTVVRAATLR